MENFNLKNTVTKSNLMGEQIANSQGNSVTEDPAESGSLILVIQCETQRESRLGEKNEESFRDMWGEKIEHSYY